MTAKEFAAQWMTDRFGIAEKRDEFKAALLKHIPDDGDWELYNDYDPRDILLDAVREVVPCAGCFFSGDGLFPRKTGIWKEGKNLTAKEGYGNIIGVVFTEE